MALNEPLCRRGRANSFIPISHENQQPFWPFKMGKFNPPPETGLFYQNSVSSYGAGRERSLQGRLLFYQHEQTHRESLRVSS